MYLPCHLNGLSDVSNDDDVAGREQEVVNGQRVADKVLLALRLRGVYGLRSQGLSGRSLRHVSLEIRAAAHLS